VIDSTTLEGARAVSFDIEGVTEGLNVIADWRDELRQIIADEMDSLDAAGLAWLRREVDRFNLACKGARR
jgi:hypothetical protein